MSDFYLKQSIFNEYIINLKNYDYTILLTYLIQKSKHHRIPFGEELLLNLNTISRDISFNIDTVKTYLHRLNRYKAINYTLIADQYVSIILSEDDLKQLEDNKDPLFKATVKSTVKKQPKNKIEKIEPIKEQSKKDIPIDKLKVARKDVATAVLQEAKETALKVNTNFSEEINDIIQHWNNLPNAVKHRPNSKTYKKIQILLDKLLSGRPLEVNNQGEASNKLRTFISYYKLNPDLVNKQWSAEEIKDTLTTIAESYTKDKPLSLESVLWNSFANRNKGFSMLLFYAGREKSIPAQYKNMAKRLAHTVDETLNELRVLDWAKEFEDLCKTEPEEEVLEILKWYGEYYGEYLYVKKVKDAKEFKYHYQKIKASKQIQEEQERVKGKPGFPSDRIVKDRDKNTNEPKENKKYWDTTEIRPKATREDGYIPPEEYRELVEKLSPEDYERWDYYRKKTNIGDAELVHKAHAIIKERGITDKEGIWKIERAVSSVKYAPDGTMQHGYMSDGVTELFYPSLPYQPKGKLDVREMAYKKAPDGTLVLAAADGSEIPTFTSEKNQGL